MTRFLFLTLLLAGPMIAQTAPLRLADVLASVEKHYPPLLAALQERVLADADVLVSQGQFDTRLGSRYSADRLGFYENQRFTAGFDQPLQFQGMNVGAGYRDGTGSFASYEGKSETRDGGEVYVGARLPLFRDREIDSRRTGLRKAMIGRKLADLSIDQQRLVIVQSATRRYWDWVFAGRRYQVALDLLQLAQQRDKILREAFGIGQIPEVEVVDNERVVAQRKATLVDSRRLLQQASFELSLFYRDDVGNPVVAREDQAPDRFPEPDDVDQTQAQRDVAQALTKRPEIQRLDGQIDQNELDVKLYRNQQKPNIDLFSNFITQIGDTRTVKRGPQELTAGVEFALPLQRRQAKGQLQAAEAKRTQFDQRMRFLKDQVTTEVRDALSAVDNARERVFVSREEYGFTRKVQDAEELKYRLGDTTLFVLNLRERDTADAALRVAAAEAEYQRAKAIYEYAIAQALR